jgi:hypothetical protein
MDMPDGWERVPHLLEGWRKGAHVVEHRWWDLPEYVWYEYYVRGEHGGFPDPVSCAVACELATGGCADGHA